MKSGLGLSTTTFVPRASSVLWMVLSLSPLLHLWIIINGVLLILLLVAAWIYNTLDASICSTIIIPDDAKAIWDDLRDRYSLGNGPCILEIKHAIADCKQRDCSVAIYYNELNKLQNLLSSYLKLPACTCSTMNEYARMHETEMLHQFCIGLDSKKFGSVVLTLLMSDPFPTMNSTYAKIVADERKQFVSDAHEASSSMTISFNDTGSAFGCSSERKDCSHCKKFGHDRDHCYDLHGFLDGSRGGRGSRGGCGGRGGRSSSKGKGEFAGSWFKVWLFVG
ncbi:2 3-bisphosphoglycerate-independent phosphoglycerate mutase [Bienertia sinuspersici]